jgi:hypothetical protein
MLVNGTEELETAGQFVGIERVPIDRANKLIVHELRSDTCALLNEVQACEKKARCDGTFGTMAFELPRKIITRE